MLSRKRVVQVAIVSVALAWALVPAGRGALLVLRAPGTTVAGGEPAGGPMEQVVFAAPDGVRLAGWFVPAAAPRGTVVLVHGFKTSRADMLDHAALLHGAGYAVLLYDSRGCGESDGVFGVGATEDRDIIGAVSFVKSRGAAGSERVAVLGVSLGAGDAVLAAARDDRIGAVIADSSWADERVQLARMGSIAIGPLQVPVLPYEAALVNALIGGRLEDARPRDVIGRIAPRPLLLIHSNDDDNATTPVRDAEALFAAAGEPKQLWLAPRGGHAGAFRADPEGYRDRLLTFLANAVR